MSPFVHINEFIRALGVADIEVRSEGAEMVKSICSELSISIIKEGSRGGPECYYFHLAFPDGVSPQKVFVKSIYHSEQLAEKYNILTLLPKFDAVMRIYGVSQYWLVCELVPEQHEHKPEQEMEPLHRILIAIDSLVNIHKLDMSTLLSSDLIEKERLTADFFDAGLVKMEAQVAKEDMNTEWGFILKWLTEHYESHFSLFTSFDDDQLVAYHGDFHQRNFMWHYHKALAGWSCSIIDWDNIAARVCWADISYLLIPHHTNTVYWQYDEEVITHYAHCFGIYDNLLIQKLLLEYYQYRIWFGVFYVGWRGTNGIESNWLSFLEHYIDKLVVLTPSIILEN